MMNMMRYLLKKLLAFFLLYLGAAILGEILIIGGLYALGFDPLHGIMPPGALGILLPYYGFLTFLLAAILYCRFVKKRNLSSMGFNKYTGDYFIGTIIAALLLLLIMGICCLTGTIFYTGMNQNVDAVYLTALFIGLMIQSTAEEALCRGFLMQSLLKLVLGKTPDTPKDTPHAANLLATLEQKVFTSQNKRHLNKGLKIAAITAGIIVAIDVISMLVYFIIYGFPS